MKDLRALVSAICIDEEREKCEIEFGDNLEWACENCEKRRLEDLDLLPYTIKLLEIRTLKAAGYPLRANDLTYEEWIDLGRIEQWLQTSEPLNLNLL